MQIKNYANLYKSDKMSKCKCKGSHLHPTEPTASVGFTLHRIKHRFTKCTSDTSA